MIGNNEKGIAFYKKIDSFYTKTNNFHPRFRDAYYGLIQLANNEEQNTKLEYINKLLKIDSLLTKSNIYINDKIVDDYEIPKLVKEKESLIEQLNEKSTSTQSWLIKSLFLLLIITLLFSYQAYMRSVYKRKAKELLNQLKLKKNIVKITSKEKITQEKTTISKEIVDSTLSNLLSFEKDLGFLDSNLSIQKLAKKVNSNTKYLSKIISTHKGGSFYHYLNELRINFALNQIKDKPTFRNYTIKAIAKECGYNQAESFSKAFYKVTGVKPSFFIKEVIKNAPDSRNTDNNNLFS